MSYIVETLRKGEDEGVDGWWSAMAEGANEIERLRAEIEKLRAGADLLDADERDAIALQALKSSYENIAYSHRDSIDEEDRRYHQDMLDTLDGAIGIFSNLEELEDWNNKKAALVK
jgi:hypothetical protein